METLVTLNLSLSVSRQWLLIYKVSAVVLALRANNESGCVTKQLRGESKQVVQDLEMKVIFRNWFSPYN